MAVSSITSSAAGGYQPNQQTNFRQTFSQLLQAIQSGDLSGARQAYAALGDLQNQGPSADANSPFAQALSQIGQALQNGDIGGAQQALQSLAQQSQATHHHHSDVASSGANSSAGDPTTLLAPGTGGNVNVTA
jgi:DNA-binding FadR family transcriptional regulator